MPIPVRTPSAAALVRLLQSTEHKRKTSLYLVRDQAMDAAGVAQEIRRLASAGHPIHALRVYDRAVNNHGVTSIRSRGGKTTYYSNEGDSYGTTLLYTVGGSVFIGDWASIVARGGYDGLGAAEPGGLHQENFRDYESAIAAFRAQGPAPGYEWLAPERPTRQLPLPFARGLGLGTPESYGARAAREEAARLLRTVGRQRLLKPVTLSSTRNSERRRVPVGAILTPVAMLPSGEAHYVVWVTADGFRGVLEGEGDSWGGLARGYAVRVDGEGLGGLGGLDGRHNETMTMLLPVGNDPTRVVKVDTIADVARLLGDTPEVVVSSATSLLLARADGRGPRNAAAVRIGGQDVRGPAILITKPAWRRILTAS